MVLDNYQRPATVEIAIKEMADYYRKTFDIHQTQAIIYIMVANDITVAAGGVPLTWRYPYSVERKTLKPSRVFIGATFLAHFNLFSLKKKKALKDPRPGAIRLAYPDGLDGHKERAYILKMLTPLERYTALRHAITMKGYEEPRSWQGGD